MAIGMKRWFFLYFTIPYIMCHLFRYHIAFIALQSPLNLQPDWLRLVSYTMTYPDVVETTNWEWEWDSIETHKKGTLSNGSCATTATCILWEETTWETLKVTENDIKRKKLVSVYHRGSSSVTYYMTEARVVWCNLLIFLDLKKLLTKWFNPTLPDCI